MRPCTGVLLYGPPGTGKTHICKALAAEAGACFINLTRASVTSKWYGETEKMVRAVFRTAEKMAPAVTRTPTLTLTLTLPLTLTLTPTLARRRGRTEP